MPNSQSLNEALEPMPDSVKKRGEILYWNGFGFQVFESSEFIICRYDDYKFDIDINTLNNMSSTHTVRLGDWIGYPYIAIHWSEYNKIQTVLDNMLKMGVSFGIPRINAGFRPSGDDSFTFEKAELKMVQSITELYNTIPNFDPDVFVDTNIYGLWNYRTEEGREFCNEIRQRKHKGPCDMNSDENYLLWDIFKNCDLTTLLDLEEPINQADNNPQNQSVDESVGESEGESIDDQSVGDQSVEITECMVCWTNPPNTRVLPCEHVVVCKQCSDGLKNTADSQTCVRCRNPIVYVCD
jgi:hypothetical protein